MERLSRGNSDATTRATRRSPLPGDAHLLGIQTHEYRRKGWWQDGPPHYFGNTGPIPYEDLAISSDACQIVREKRLTTKETRKITERFDHCQQSGYRPAHVYISFKDDHFETYLDLLRENDPWAQNPALRRQVHLVKHRPSDSTDQTDGVRVMLYPDGVASSRTIRELQENLLHECQVIQYIAFGGHGSPGSAGFYNHSVTSFLKDVISPCLMAPGAKIQFNGCNQAVDEVHEAILAGLKKVYLKAGYRTASNQPAFEGLEVLLNADFGYSIKQVSRSPKRYVLTTRSEGDLAVVYSIRSNQVVSDTRQYELTSWVNLSPHRFIDVANAEPIGTDYRRWRKDRRSDQSEDRAPGRRGRVEVIRLPKMHLIRGSRKP